jgi:hypothetical protein
MASGTTPTFANRRAALSAAALLASCLALTACTASASNVDAPGGRLLLDEVLNEVLNEEASNEEVLNDADDTSLDEDRPEASKKDRLLAVYAVPANHVDRYDVDACWGGPHITLAGFAAYPDRRDSGQSTLTYDEAFDAVKSAAKAACKGGKPWAATSRNSRFTTAKVSTRRSTSPRHLEFGTKDKPSNTLQHVADELQSFGFQRVKFQSGAASTKLGPHVTFDQCGCYGRCSVSTMTEWEMKRTNWKLIPVSAAVGTKFPATKSCESLQGETKAVTHGTCEKRFAVTWHPHHGRTIMSC